MKNILKMFSQVALFSFGGKLARLLLLEIGCCKAVDLEVLFKIRNNLK